MLCGVAQRIATSPRLLPLEIIVISSNSFDNSFILSHRASATCFVCDKGRFEDFYSWLAFLPHVICVEFFACFTNVTTEKESL
jgi:hypothetical protein